MRQIIMRFNNKNWSLPEPVVPIWDGLTFTALQDGSQIKFTRSTTGNRIVYYSTDAVTWTELGNSYITLNNGDHIFVRAAFTSSTNYQTTPQFNMTGKWKASGKISSLLYTDDTYTTRRTSSVTCGFCRLFYNCSALYNVSELDFDHMTGLGGTGATSMFQGCSNITAITVNVNPIGGDRNTIQGMFYGCSNLSYIAFPNAVGTLPTGRSGFTNGVAASGTFVKNAAQSGWGTGQTGIPTGWTVVNVN